MEAEQFLTRPDLNLQLHGEELNRSSGTPLNDRFRGLAREFSKPENRQSFGSAEKTIPGRP
jgi:hypothetical protein